MNDVPTNLENILTTYKDIEECRLSLLLLNFFKESVSCINVNLKTHLDENHRAQKGIKLISTYFKVCAYPPIKVYGRAHALREYEARKKSPTKKSSFKVSKADDYCGVKT